MEDLLAWPGRTFCARSWSRAKIYILNIFTFLVMYLLERAVTIWKHFPGSGSCPGPYTNDRQEFITYSQHLAFL